MRARSAAVVTLTLLLAASCSPGRSHKPASATTTTSSSVVTTSTSSAPATTVPFDGSTRATSSPGDTSSTAYLRTVSVTHDGAIDRVTFEFEGNRHPGLALEYVDHPVADGSGAAVPVRGGATLKVRFEPASTSDLTGESPRRVYNGPDHVTGTSTAVTEVVEGGDFEGVLTWFIGVATRAPFRIVPAPSTSARVTIELAAPVS
jgi:hypothetical protein